MGLSATPIVRLKCSFRHSSEYLLLTKTPRLIVALAYVKKASDFPQAHCRFGSEGLSLRAKRKAIVVSLYSYRTIRCCSQESEVDFCFITGGRLINRKLLC